MTTLAEVWLNFDLKLDTPQEILDVLHYMMGTRTDIEQGAIEAMATLFDGDALILKGILSAGHEMMRMPGRTISSLQPAYRYELPLAQGGAAVYFQTFSLHAERVSDMLPDYMPILKWLAPYIETRGFVGFWRSEVDVSPILLYVNNGSLFMLDVDQNPFHPAQEYRLNK